MSLIAEEVTVTGRAGKQTRATLLLRSLTPSSPPTTHLEYAGGIEAAYDHEGAFAELELSHLTIKAWKLNPKLEGQTLRIPAHVNPDTITLSQVNLEEALKQASLTKLQALRNTEGVELFMAFGRPRELIAARNEEILWSWTLDYQHPGRNSAYDKAWLQHAEARRDFAQSTWLAVPPHAIDSIIIEQQVLHSRVFLTAERDELQVRLAEINAQLTNKNAIIREWLEFSNPTGTQLHRVTQSMSPEHGVIIERHAL